jgi:plastocyanin
MRHATLLLGALLLLAAPSALAAEQEHMVYLHEYEGGLHIVPEQINARVGDTLRFTVRNEGQSPHNLVMCGDGEEFESKCDERWAFTPLIQANASAPMSFEVKEAGRFEYYCYIAGHKSGGMSGVLVVQGEAQPKNAVSWGPVALAGLAVAAALAMRRKAA